MIEHLGIDLGYLGRKIGISIQLLTFDNFHGIRIAIHNDCLLWPLAL